MPEKQLVRIYLLVIFSVILVQPAAKAFAMPADSIGVERKNGKTFVLHKVEPKETLYALSRKYKVTVAQIVEANPNLESTINIGQTVYIPRPWVPTSTTTPVAQPARTFTVDQRGAKLHRVEPKQTLYAISRMYNVSVGDIRKWNNLKTDQVKIGETLVVGYGSKPTKNPLYVPEADDEVGMPRTSEATAKKEEAPESPERREDVRSAEFVRENDPVKTSTVVSTSKITETGLAEVIDQKIDTNKFLALHKTAPVGTILQVKNIMNNQTVYVRVIGKLPETGNNEKVVVKISKRAYQRLAAIDSRFRVEVSYMP